MMRCFRIDSPFHRWLDTLYSERNYCALQGFFQGYGESLGRDSLGSLVSVTDIKPAANGSAEPAAITECFMGGEGGRSQVKKTGRRQMSKEPSLSKESMTRKNTAVQLNSEAQSQIGEKLKALYDDVVNQPIPDRFRELLDQLDRRRQDKDGNTLN